MLCNTSAYWPYPDELSHSVQASTAVPSPHSLKVVMSCHGSLLLTMPITLVRHSSIDSLARMGVPSVTFQNPGEMENEYPGLWTTAVAGPYSCQ